MDEAIRQARKEIPWLGVVPAQAAQAVLKTYVQAWKNCWDGRAEEPAFKKRTARRAVDIPQGRDLRIKRLSRHWGQCWVPMIGPVKFRWTKNLPVGRRADKLNRITGARLVHDAPGWHIVFRVRTEVDEPKPHQGLITGIDRGIAKLLALSNGTFREHGPWLTPGEAKRMKRLEQKRERQRSDHEPGQPTSNRLRRTYDQIRQLRARATRRALDWQHKTTTELADACGIIGVEDLAIRSMVKSAKGTVEAPGTKVRQKAGLNRSISGESWGRAITLLEYKLADRGGILVKVPAPNTSRRCSACGFITPGSRESQDRFVCRADGCGYQVNADTNAARNIEHAAGHAVSGRGDLGDAQS
ncbi:RNA-guided endonuclease TnpB family protein [Streptomyces sp. 8K308]|uniref:RNA-guided endonuclease InsQ/TnpB family protein n=1 Tax=Streptomyces sp. 8K308 TaxID=2530388 RepID=UPI001A9EFBB8|nr:RNA-guided endonuclease TnpB family protein [Streptomyces sp. 8K308]